MMAERSSNVTPNQSITLSNVIGALGSSIECISLDQIF